MSIVLHVTVFACLTIWLAVPAESPAEPLIPTPQGLVLLSPFPRNDPSPRDAEAPAVEVGRDTASTSVIDQPMPEDIAVPPLESDHDASVMILGRSTPSMQASHLVTATPIAAHGNARSAASVAAQIEAALGPASASTHTTDSGAPGAEWKPHFVSGKDPTYPRNARRLHLEGAVRLQLDIARDGTVRAANIKRSSGCDDLDQAAIGAAYAWLFSPCPVERQDPLARVELEVVFRLVACLAPQPQLLSSLP